MINWQSSLPKLIHDHPKEHGNRAQRRAWAKEQKAKNKIVKDGIRK